MYLKPSVSVSYFLLPFFKDLTVEAVERGGGEQSWHQTPWNHSIAPPLSSWESLGKILSKVLCLHFASLLEILNNVIT